MILSASDGALISPTNLFEICAPQPTLVLKVDFKKLSVDELCSTARASVGRLKFPGNHKEIKTQRILIKSVILQSHLGTMGKTQKNLIYCILLYLKGDLVLIPEELTEAIYRTWNQFQWCALITDLHQPYITTLRTELLGTTDF